MGQQQLLLLVLGLVIVGLAVVVGIQAFESNQRQFRQDQTVAFMTDLAAKAQLWKATPPPLGGGGAGEANDFSAFTLEAVGIAATTTHGTTEVLYRTEYACLKIFPFDDRLEVNALDIDCTNGSWWMKLTVVGPGPGDISVRMNSDGDAIRDNGL